MTLLGLVELSQTPNRAVRGSVLSAFLAAAAAAGAWAEAGIAANSAAVKDGSANKQISVSHRFNPSWRPGCSEYRARIPNAAKRRNARQSSL